MTSPRPLIVIRKKRGLDACVSAFFDKRWQWRCRDASCIGMRESLGSSQWRGARSQWDALSQAQMHVIRLHPGSIK